jgi:hypothetical protein
MITNYISPYPPGYLKTHQLISNPMVIPIHRVGQPSVEASSFTKENNPGAKSESKGFTVLWFLCGLAVTVFLIYNASKPQHKLNNKENYE